MLVLSRRCDECIVIDGKITVKIIEVRGQQVRWASKPPPISRSCAKNCWPAKSR